jgi:aminoglycoside 2''-phosphotransferase
VLKPFLKSETLARLDSFFSSDLHKAYATAPRKTVIHGDLADDHMLIAGGKISGIIDFSDATIGDPAFDFTFFWFYGDKFMNDVVHAYGKIDSGFKERSRAHFIRFVSRNLWLSLERKKPTMAKWWLVYVENHLARPFVF